MIRIDAAWLAVEPLDMRAGTETALARVVSVFGSARAHHAYLFANRRANRMKVLVHDGFGLWLCARRLHRGQFVWARSASGTTVALSSEQIEGLQRSLLEESIDEDLEAIAVELEQLKATPAQRPKGIPKRAALPKDLPRIEIRHEPDSTVCGCGCELKRIGEDVSEKLDFIPGVLQVERHIRGEWVCARCETLIQAPVPPQVIDRGSRRRGSSCR